MMGKDHFLIYGNLIKSLDIRCYFFEKKFFCASRIIFLRFYFCFLLKINKFFRLRRNILHRLRRLRNLIYAYRDIFYALDFCTIFCTGFSTGCSMASMRCIFSCVRSVGRHSTFGCIDSAIGAILLL